jgi:hypothetical protein
MRLGDMMFSNCFASTYSMSSVPYYRRLFSYSQFFFLCSLKKLFYPFFLPNFVASNCCSSYYLVSSLQLPYGSGETKVEGHASSDTQPNQAALLLNTVRIQLGSQPHQCAGGNTVHLATLASAHCARPATGVASARWDKDIPTSQTLPNPDDARPIVRRPMDLPVTAGCDRAWAQTQSLWWHS